MDLSAQKRNDGVPRFTIEHAPIGFELRVRGRRFECNLNGETIDDYQLPAECEFQGVKLEIANFTDGDYAELHVMMPGDPPVGVVQFGHTVYVKPSGCIEVVADGTVTLPAGLILRIDYTSVAESGDKPIVYADYWIWESE